MEICSTSALRLENSKCPRGRITLVVRWIDRLGRNYADVTDTIREFIRRGVIVRTIINGPGMIYQK